MSDTGHPLRDGLSPTVEPVNSLDGFATSIPDAHEAMCNAEIVDAVRRVAKEVTGGNAAFADDDIRILGGLAAIAIDAGLTDHIWQGSRTKKAVKQASDERKAKATETGTAETLGSVREADDGAVAESHLPDSSMDKGAEQ